MRRNTLLFNGLRISLNERLLIVRDVKNLDAILCKKLQIDTFKLNEHFSGKSYTLG